MSHMLLRSALYLGLVTVAPCVFAADTALAEADQPEVIFGPFSFKPSQDWNLRKGLVGNRLLNHKDLGLDVVVNGIVDSKAGVSDEFVRNLARGTEGYAQGSAIKSLSTFGGLKGHGKILDFTAHKLPRRLLVFWTEYPKAFTVSENPRQLNGLQLTAEGPKSSFDDVAWKNFARSFSQQSAQTFTDLNLPSFEQLMQLPKEGRTTYIKEMRALLVELEADQRRSAPELYSSNWLRSLVMEVADAEEPAGRPFCVFAGNMSRFVKVGGADRCLRPASTACQVSDVPCNPHLYGYREGSGDTGKPFCVKADTYATSNCEKKGKSPTVVAGELTREVWQAHVNDIQQYCTHPAPRQLGVCAKIVKRSQAISANSKSLAAIKLPNFEMPRVGPVSVRPLKMENLQASFSQSTEESKRRQEAALSEIERKEKADAITSSCNRGQHKIEFSCHGHKLKVEWKLEVPEKPVGSDKLFTVAKVLKRNSKGSFVENQDLTSLLNANISQRETLEVSEIYGDRLNWIQVVAAENNQFDVLLRRAPHLQAQFNEIITTYDNSRIASASSEFNEDELKEFRQRYADAHKTFWAPVEVDLKQYKTDDSRRILPQQLDQQWRLGVKQTADKLTCVNTDLHAREPQEESLRQTRKVEQGLTNVACLALNPNYKPDPVGITRVRPNRDTGESTNK